MRRSEAERRGLTPLATIVAHTSHSQEPRWFTTAPVGAMQKLFEKTGWDKDEVEFYEINEAFAVVPMAAMREFGLPAEKVNVHGGACALGHPVGASGARIVATLINAMQRERREEGRCGDLHRRRRGDGMAIETRGVTRRLISSGGRYEAAAGYSRAVVQDGWVHVAGTTGADPETGGDPRGRRRAGTPCLRHHRGRRWRRPEPASKTSCASPIS